MGMDFVVFGGGGEGEGGSLCFFEERLFRCTVAYSVDRIG